MGSNTSATVDEQPCKSSKDSGCHSGVQVKVRVPKVKLVSSSNTSINGDLEHSTTPATPSGSSDDFKKIKVPISATMVSNNNFLCRLEDVDNFTFRMALLNIPGRMKQRVLRVLKKNNSYDDFSGSPSDTEVDSFVVTNDIAPLAPDSPQDVANRKIKQKRKGHHSPPGRDSTEDSGICDEGLLDEVDLTTLLARGFNPNDNVGSSRTTQGRLLRARGKPGTTST